MKGHGCEECEAYLAAVGGSPAEREALLNTCSRLDEFFAVFLFFIFLGGFFSSFFCSSRVRVESFFGVFFRGEVGGCWFCFVFFRKG